MGVDMGNGQSWTRIETLGLARMLVVFREDWFDVMTMTGYGLYGVCGRYV
jgi:hypothetical protein